MILEFPTATDDQLAMINRAILETRSNWRPPTNLKVSEFSDQEIMVTSGPLAGTRWRTDFAPYQRAILDAVHEPAEFIVIMGSSQWGKTACAVNIVAYHIAHAPCGILVVEPTVEPMAKDFAKNRLDPAIKASPLLDAAVDKKRQKDASNTTLLKTYKGGFLAIAGANSAASLAARPVQLLVLDEIDRYERELKGEGSTIAVAIKRTTSFRQRRRVLMFSSPTVAGAPIHDWFERGDQRRYHVPCPGCGEYFSYAWAQVRWTDADPKTARLHCPSCDLAIDEAQRVALLARGEWSGTAIAADARVISFHLSELFSPLSSLSSIVAGFLQARAAQKAGDDAEMHTWQNTTLGEPIEPQRGQGIEKDALLARREPYAAPVPAGACCLTMGVDVQNDRLEAFVVGWGPGEESWFIDHRILLGDTSQAVVWEELDALIESRYMHVCGERLPISATCVDSGDRTGTVYQFAAPRLAKRVYAIKGRAKVDFINPKPTRIQLRTGGQVQLFIVGTDAAKTLVTARLKLELTAPGAVHLPQADWANEEFVAQLTSERLFKRFHKGVPIYEWRQTRERNEAIDGFVYALAALRLARPDFAALAERLQSPRPPSPPAPPPPTGRWIQPRRNWLKGSR